jgi:hypothetical protein
MARWLRSSQGTVSGWMTFLRPEGANLAYHWTDNIEQNVATLRKS